MKTERLSACVDANVFISGIAFGGTPLKVVEKALSRDFMLITSEAILSEVRRNLLGKLALPRARVMRFLEDIEAVGSIFVPSGRIKFIEYQADNLVIETALMGGADVLVTGDRKHLLPLGKIERMAIEPPSKFLSRLMGTISGPA